MEYSGPAAIAEVEHDPHLSDNEEQAMEHWPPLKPSAQHEFQSVAASTSTKRPKDYGSDTSSEPQSPAAKLTKCNEHPTRQETDVTLPRKLPLPVPLISSSAAPTFAPRDDYIKLAFRENLTSDTKLRWLTEINKLFSMDQELAEVKMSAVTSSCGRVVWDILCQLAAAHNASLVLSFVWMPSHIGFAGNDTVDSLAKAACMMGFEGGDAQPSLRCLQHRIYSSALASTVQRRDEERDNSVSIQHHDNFLQNRYKYRRHGLMVRRHNVVSARLRLGN
ncbi:hypothetical protein Pmani_009930 [Petrolisthes manimaculis]|uniref:RNase H type-1 domain-containing protein n=1 Tax=Petrolisthes manimaculis TaxID=1843537 RepID=A0AAE1UD57_9EUCA|nr:hypothetical protein Pmani_009930 [Petrolisthes manimaculis]